MFGLRWLTLRFALLNEVMRTHKRASLFASYTGVRVILVHRIMNYLNGELKLVAEQFKLLGVSQNFNGCCYSDC